PPPLAKPASGSSASRRTPGRAIRSWLTPVGADAKALLNEIVRARDDVHREVRERFPDSNVKRREILVADEALAIQESVMSELRSMLLDLPALEKGTSLPPSRVS